MVLEFLIHSFMMGWLIYGYFIYNDSLNTCYNVKETIVMAQFMYVWLWITIPIVVLIVLCLTVLFLQAIYRCCCGKEREVIDSHHEGGHDELFFKM